MRIAIAPEGGNFPPQSLLRNLPLFKIGGQKRLESGNSDAA